MRTKKPFPSLLSTATISRHLTGRSVLRITGSQGDIKVLADPVELVEMMEEAQHNGGYLTLRLKILADELPRLLAEARAVPISRISMVAGLAETAGERADELRDRGAASAPEKIRWSQFPPSEPTSPLHPKG